MVVAAPRQIIASSALPASKATKPHSAQETHPHSDGNCVTRESYTLDMRELRASSTVGRALTTELKQQTRVYNVKSFPALKCSPTAYAFVYGTLKKGFSNHWLMEDVVAKGHARFLGTARTKEKFPMVCGPYQVPFLIDLPSTGHHVRGELYEVDCHAIERLDELEGVSKGNYVRRSIVLSDLQLEPDYSNSVDLIAHAYFAAPSYASRLAVAPHIEAFTEKESATYVRRKDRPQNRTFLQHIEHWIKAQEVARRTNQCSKILH